MQDFAGLYNINASMWIHNTWKEQGTKNKSRAKQQTPDHILYHLVFYWPVSTMFNFSHIIVIKHFKQPIL